MRRIVNFFAGSVTIKVTGSYPERFLNLCARNGIKFRDMKICDIGVMTITISAKSFLQIAPVAKKSMCRVHIISKNGAPFLTRRISRRKVLMAGCAVFCLAAWIFTGFVWSIDIDGFEGLNEEKLMSELSLQGLRIGAFHSAIDLEELRNNILIDMPELAYVYVNFSGAKANVIARKRLSPPDILPADTPCDIIADKDGIINSITVKTGTPEVKKGDTVIKGQLLASGYITGREGTTVVTHADAFITAKTWLNISSKMQKKINRKVYTGREKTCYTIILLNKRIKLYPNSRILYTKCDKIIKRNNLSVSDSIILPLSLECATYREYELEEDIMRDDVAFEIMSQALNERLSDSKNSELVNTKLQTRADEDFAYVSMVAERIEEIGIERKILKDG